MGFGSKNCGYCSGIGTIRKSVSNNILKCTCTICKKHYELSLMKIEKKIIYLDQNLFSDIWKNSSHFDAVIEQLNSLTQKQLIACPYSDVHEKETLLFSGHKELLKSIKKLSRGKKFKYQSSIKDQQILNAYISFIRNGSDKYKLDLTEALYPDVHDWDNSLNVDISMDFINPQELKEKKEFATEKIIQSLNGWKKNKRSLEDLYQHELKEHINLFITAYQKMIISSDMVGIIENVKCQTINMLLEVSGSIEDFHKNFFTFLMSKNFSNIPHVNISAGLWALLREDVHKNQFTSGKDLRRKVGGLVFDIEHLSIFAPYCDAVFTENKMAKWLQKWSKHQLGGYNFEIFSKDNLNDFIVYLKNIEDNISPEMHEELKIVYGG